MGEILMHPIDGAGSDAATVNGHTVESNVPADAKFTDTTYSVATSSADGLMSAADKSKLDDIGAGSNVKSVNGKTGAVSLSKADVGLGNVDNTSDADKPISTAVQEALDGKANNSVATSSSSGLMSAADKAKLDGIGAGSNVKSVNGKTGAVTLAKSDVGLGSVANLDQSKAIKSITRSGTTFIATALDGTRTTFTQQDDNTTYDLASKSSNGLMSAADKNAVDREFFRMLPKGGTEIPNGENLNSISYLEVGNYYQSETVNTTNMKNIPIKSAFMMYVLSPLSEEYDDECDLTWVRRLRIFVEYTGSFIYTQNVHSGNTAGVFTYGPWVKMTNSNDLGAVSKIINDHIANKSNPHDVTKAQVGLGSVANLDQSKAIKSITRSGTTFTATALDGTTTTFTQQDNNTTYDIATSSTDGLMSKSDKAKLDGVAAGADVSPIKTVKVNGIALTPDSNKAVNVTYPVFAGATASENGTTGLVPEPTIEDADKYLCGDGTWKIVSGGTSDSPHEIPIEKFTSVTDGSITVYRIGHLLHIVAGPLSVNWNESPDIPIFKIKDIDGFHFTSSVSTWVAVNSHLIPNIFGIALASSEIGDYLTIVLIGNPGVSQTNILFSMTVPLLDAEGGDVV